MPSTCAIIDCDKNATVTDFDITLLQLRAKDVVKNTDIDYLCKVHYNKFFKYYTKRKSDRKCFNPWNVHKKNIVKSLTIITPEEAETYKVTSGTCICWNCKKRFI